MQAGGADHAVATGRRRALQQLAQFALFPGKTYACSMDRKRLQALFCVFEGERTAIILCFDRSFGCATVQ